ncbi:MAG TPA: hypothetical protein VJN94_10575, partial [Candidatus Binataceae bacterium]|nr:hypothetical protein [Candidatus Binataceae bacterium]
MFSRSRIALLLGLLAFCVAGIPAQAVAQCDHSSISVHVDSVVAGDTRAWVDPRLGPAILGRLTPLFDYRSYQLVRTDIADTPCGQAVAFNLPSGRILHVVPIAIRGDTIALDLALFAGTGTVMRTELKLVKSGMLVLVGPQDQQGADITTIAIEVRNP